MKQNKNADFHKNVYQQNKNRFYSARNETVYSDGNKGKMWKNIYKKNI